MNASPMRVFEALLKSLPVRLVKRFTMYNNYYGEVDGERGIEYRHSIVSVNLEVKTNYYDS